MSTNPINVLIFPAGAENALEVYNSLKYNLHVEVFGASGKRDHAQYAYPSSRYIEGEFFIDRDGFLETFNAALAKHSIAAVIPTHDSIALYLAEHRDEIQARIVTSPVETARTAREKRLTFRLFENEAFCPRVFDSPLEVDAFPVFVKPNIGEGSRGVSLVHSREELAVAESRANDLIISEYLPGRELTVDCFTDRKRRLLFVGPRTRERIQIGISFHSESIPLTEEIQQIAAKINETLVFRGSWFFQLKQGLEGKYKLLEISTRPAGTMALYRQLGVNFALLSVFDAIDVDVTVLVNGLSVSLDRCLHNRYRINYRYKTVYVDFDDTIIIRGQVNTQLIRFLYECRNKGIRLILITKHELDIHESLARYAIAENLFDSIIVVPALDEKVHVIDPRDAIFIDNHFLERKRVSEALGIPVFDVDAVECLVE